MATVEREWSIANPLGRFTPIAGPTFVFWNFDINESLPKQQHLNHIRDTEFSLFLKQNLNRGRKFLIVGCSSTSGGQVFNRDLAQQRAFNIRYWIFDRLKELRRTGDIDRGLSDDTLAYQLTVGVKPMTNYFGFYDPNDPSTRIFMNPGAEMAANRSVAVEGSVFCRIDQSSVEVIARNFLRRERALRLPQDFPLMDMWIPYFPSYKSLIPATMSRSLAGSDVGTNIPERRIWRSFPNGYEALTAAGCIGIRLRESLLTHFCSERDIIQAIRDFITAARSVGRQIWSEEDHILFSMGASPGFGSIPSMEQIQRYVLFRDQIILGKNDSFLKYSGFRPRLMP